MERSDFERLLQQYPIVRSSSARREWYAADCRANAAAAAIAAVAVSSSPAATSPAASPSDAPSSATASAAASPAAPATSGLFPQLSSHLLLSGYSSEQSAAIVAHFQRAHANTLACLNLDEMELIASSLPPRASAACSQQQHAASDTSAHLDAAVMVD